MHYKHVLYTERLSEEMRTKLRILKYRKIKSKKNNVYFVDFATAEDAQYAQKACKRIQNVTIKPFEPKSSTAMITPHQTVPSVTVVVAEKQTTAIAAHSQFPQAKIKLLSRCLPPNSSETRQLLESIDACLNAMTLVKHTFDEISQSPRK